MYDETFIWQTERTKSGKQTVTHHAAPWQAQLHLYLYLGPSNVQGVPGPGIPHSMQSAWVTAGNDVEQVAAEVLRLHLEALQHRQWPREARPKWDRPGHLSWLSHHHFPSSGVHFKKLFHLHLNTFQYFKFKKKHG